MKERKIPKAPFMLFDIPYNSASTAVTISARHSSSSWLQNRLSIPHLFKFSSMMKTARRLSLVRSRKNVFITSEDKRVVNLSQLYSVPKQR